MQALNASPVSTVENRIITLIAEATRYPREILDPAAELENDLGIDSVKRAEIWGTLLSSFALPNNQELPQPRTIGDVITTMSGLVASAGGAGTAGDSGASLIDVAQAPLTVSSPAAQPHAITAVSKLANGALEKHILEVIAETTRYPVDVLQPEAELENDLGIDSVKRVEIWSVLAQRFALPVEDDKGSGIRTIGDVVNRVYASMGASREAEPFSATSVSSIATHNTGNQPTHSPANNLSSITNGSSFPHAKNGFPVSAVPSNKVQAQPSSLSPGQPFAGKRAFISGSGHGLGKVLALRLASLGAEVILNSFHSRALGEQAAAELCSQGFSATHVWGSMANPAQVNEVFDRITADGPLDFFISNASNGIVAPLDQVTPDHWDIAFRTNVVGLHQGALRAAKLMEGRGGRIIALSSPGANRCFENYGCMGPVKAALESLVRYLALHLGPANILVNAISAGPMHGDLLSRYPNSDRLIPYWESRTPGGELVTEAEIADLVMFLLSPESRSINGSVLVADRGLSLPI